MAKRMRATKMNENDRDVALHDLTIAPLIQEAAEAASVLTDAATSNSEAEKMTHAAATRSRGTVGYGSSTPSAASQVGEAAAAAATNSAKGKSTLRM